MKAELAITGMSCAGCVDRVESSLAEARGVRKAEVNIATDRARVEYDPAATDVDALIKAVEDAGYGARDAGDLWSEALRVAEGEESRLKREEFETLRLFLVLFDRERVNGAQRLELFPNKRRLGAQRLVVKHERLGAGKQPVDRFFPFGLQPLADRRAPA